MKTYTPTPVDIENVELPEKLSRLAEKMAKNVHEEWAEARIEEGWKYGPQRDDKLKTTPCLVPYELLPEREKEYDRRTAMATLKFILKMGFSISENRM